MSGADLKKARGARVQDNDIILDVSRAMPPPAIQGRLSRVHIEGDQLVQHFIPMSDDAGFSVRPRPDLKVRNYMFYRGGVLQFGKLVMLDADLQIVDLDRMLAAELWQVGPTLHGLGLDVGGRLAPPRRWPGWVPKVRPSASTRRGSGASARCWPAGGRSEPWEDCRSPVPVGQSPVFSRSDVFPR